MTGSDWFFETRAQDGTALKIKDNGKALEAWLSTQPRTVAIVIAARAALRVLPLVARDAPEQGDAKALQEFSNLTFLIFIGTALARFAGRYPDYASELRTRAAGYALSAYAGSSYAESAAAAAYAADGTASAPALASAAAAAIASAVDAAAEDTHNAAVDEDTSRVIAIAYADAENAAAVRAADAASAWEQAMRIVSDAEARAAAAPRSARGALFGAVSLDAKFIADGGSAAALADRLLWPGKTPTWAVENWEKLCAVLPLGEDWDVWTRWYEDILTGRPRGEAHDLVFANVPHELWQTPAAAKAWIKEQLAKLESKGENEPRVPPQKPAAIEPVFRDGKIALPASGAAAELDAGALDAALAALRALVARLAKDIDGEANIDKRAIALLRHLSETIPVREPTQVQLFEIAHELEGLEDYGKKVVAEWPDVLASRYLGILRAFDDTMRQFEKWRLFKQNALKDRLTEEQREIAPIIARKIAAALREAGNAKFVESEVASAIEEMVRRLEQSEKNMLAHAPDEASADTRPEDLVTSSENIIKRMGEAAVDAEAGRPGKGEKAYAGKVGRGFAKYVKDGDKVGEDMGKWATRTLISGGASTLSLAVYELMEHFPAVAQWLRTIIEHFTH